MARVIDYGEIVKAVIREYASAKPSVGEIRVEMVIDDAQGHYEIMHSGWARQTRVHGPVLHLDMHDGTNTGVVDDLASDVEDVGKRRPGDPKLQATVGGSVDYRPQGR